MLALFVFVLFLHWFGDFVCQTRWMADNKSKNWEALAAHVFVYSFVLFGGMLLTGLYSMDLLCQFAIINFIIHFIVDAITSRATKWAIEQKNMHRFFAIIGFDQFLHATTLLVTVQYLLGGL